MLQFSLLSLVVGLCLLVPAQLGVFDNHAFLATTYQFAPKDVDFAYPIVTIYTFLPLFIYDQKTLERIKYFQILSGNKAFQVFQRKEDYPFYQKVEIEVNDEDEDGKLLANELKKLPYVSTLRMKNLRRSSRNRGLNKREEELSGSDYLLFSISNQMVIKDSILNTENDQYGNIVGTVNAQVLEFNHEEFKFIAVVLTLKKSYLNELFLIMEINGRNDFELNKNITEKLKVLTNKKKQEIYIKMAPISIVTYQSLNDLFKKMDIDPKQKTFISNVNVDIEADKDKIVEEKEFTECRKIYFDKPFLFMLRMKVLDTISLLGSSHFFNEKKRISE